MVAALGRLGRLLAAGGDFGRRFAQLRVPQYFGSPFDELASVPVYGGRVAFGVDPVVSGRLGRVRELPRNPFELTGVRPGSALGRSLTDDYVAAVGGARSVGLPETDVDALLYLMRGGFEGAGEAFVSLARRGERVPFSSRLRSADADLSGLVLVHGTDFAPQRVGSDVVLRPTGDWRSSTGGKSVMDYVRDYDAAGRPTDGSVYYPWRDTVHFSLNHRVAPVVGMGEMFDWSQKPYWIMSNLSDVMDANPGALANLARMDTFFVPPAGQGLRLPGATVLELPEQVGSRQVTMPSEFGDWTREMTDKEYFDFLVQREIEARGGRVFPDSPEFLGGSRESIGDADRQLDALSKTLGVPLMRHFESPYYYAESNPWAYTYNKGRGEDLPWFTPAEYRPTISRNLYERILARGGLSGVNYGPLPRDPNQSPYNL